jgi:hypothetical protein
VTASFPADTSTFRPTPGRSQAAIATPLSIAPLCEITEIPPGRRLCRLAMVRLMPCRTLM